MTDSTTDTIRGFLDDCVSIDIEYDPARERILKVGGVSADPDGPEFKGGWSPEHFNQFRGGRGHVVGHHVLRHDAPILEAEFGEPIFDGVALVDTLWLNPLAFPDRPFHKLNKQHLDGALEFSHNDPVKDARAAFDLLEQQIEAFVHMNRADSDLVAAFHGFCGSRSGFSGFDNLFAAVRGRPRPDAREVREAVVRLLDGRACATAADVAAPPSMDGARGWSLAHALAWIAGNAGGDASPALPGFVRNAFPETTRILKETRDTNCGDPGCRYCAEAHDPDLQLKKWLDHDSFRPHPADEAGLPLQRAITAAVLNGESVLGILPTGTGKSVCYQLPAVTKHDRTGALTVVFSPLTVLMADQIESMRRGGVTNAVAINGTMSLPERHRALEEVALGRAAILLIAPEQLRNPSVRNALKQRDVAFWAIDEAHCLSKWGHDFRTDYRYISRHIREFHHDPDPRVVCLTSTAKPDVVRDIVDHFGNPERVNVDMKVFDGGAERTNLAFSVMSTEKTRKAADILRTLRERLPEDGTSGAIVYHATRSATEDTAEHLAANGVSADHFHAGLDPDIKRDVQARFMRGDLRVVVATNAFGMGIDKLDIRLVIHADSTDSLENYMQEAGRAGRDGAPAECVLLRAPGDIDRRFTLAAESRVGKNFINAVGAGVKTLNANRFKGRGEVVATAPEIIRSTHIRPETEIEIASMDTSVKTALAWLENANLMRRDENRPRVFPSKLRNDSLDEIIAKIDQNTGRSGITRAAAENMRRIVEMLHAADKEKGVTSDHIAGSLGIEYPEFRKHMKYLEDIGVVDDDTRVTLFPHKGRGLDEARKLEGAALRWVFENNREDVEALKAFTVKITEIRQALKEQGFQNVRPDTIDNLFRVIGQDGATPGDADEHKGSMTVQRKSHNLIMIKTNYLWETILKRAEIRGKAAEVLLGGALDGKIGGAKRGAKSIETTLGELTGILRGDVTLREQRIEDHFRLLRSTILWLHDRDIMNVGPGMAVFRSAMTIRLPKGKESTGKRKFTDEDYRELEAHHDEKNLQIHVMNLYGEKALESPEKGSEVVTDHFTMERDDFVKKWFPGRGQEIKRRCSAKMYGKITDGLTKEQFPIVTESRPNTNTLVLAGPGSGKTHIIVHRAAYLIKVLRESPSSVMIMTYNRHAADEIRRRLHALIGTVAGRVHIATMHKTAMRLLGESFVDRDWRDDENMKEELNAILMEAADALNGKGLDDGEKARQRADIIRGRRHLLIDEYQDVGEEQYEFIKAITGSLAMTDHKVRNREKEEINNTVNIFAVGDDDQNIYSFNGASVEFIRRFGEDYIGKTNVNGEDEVVHTARLTENHRCSKNIIDATNAVIEPAGNRMKYGWPITVDAARQNTASGGVFADHDNLATGRVQILRCPSDPDSQAMAVLDELNRLGGIAGDILPEEEFWKSCAVIGRDWKDLDPIMDLARRREIPIDPHSGETPPLWRTREMEHVTTEIRRNRNSETSASELRGRLRDVQFTKWAEMIAGILELMRKELGDNPVRAEDALDWLWESCRDSRSHQKGLRLLVAHKAKGLEFSHVAIVDGNWGRTDKNEDPDAARRLLYVSMTRARHTLTMVDGRASPFIPKGLPAVKERSVKPKLIDGPRQRHVMATLRDVSMAHPAYLKGTRRIEAVSKALVGDDLTLVPEKNWKKRPIWTLRDADGVDIGRMAREFSPPSNTRFVSASVAAIICHDREKYLKSGIPYEVHHDEWEFIVPEFIFEYIPSDPKSNTRNLRTEDITEVPIATGYWANGGREIPAQR